MSNLVYNTERLGLLPDTPKKSWAYVIRNNLHGGCIICYVSRDGSEIHICGNNADGTPATGGLTADVVERVNNEVIEMGGPFQTAGDSGLYQGQIVDETIATASRDGYNTKGDNLTVETMADVLLIENPLNATSVLVEDTGDVLMYSDKQEDWFSVGTGTNPDQWIAGTTLTQAEVDSDWLNT